MSKGLIGMPNVVDAATKAKMDERERINAACKAAGIGPPSNDDELRLIVWQTSGSSMEVIARLRSLGLVKPLVEFQKAYAQLRMWVKAARRAGIELRDFPKGRKTKFSGDSLPRLKNIAQRLSPPKAERRTDDE